ncbi:hypothetical protein RRG08_043274 [Elysia crispata]|uniref:Uncharacterized protein n=1 Tax=Elysia crispata TaxID=231223 RepID=A0AAE1CP75_9GAST|nr:hypothetical protein RRG08_043274 [Elysia crispata]
MGRDLSMILSTRLGVGRCEEQAAKLLDHIIDFWPWRLQEKVQRTVGGKHTRKSSRPATGGSCPGGEQGHAHAEEIIRAALIAWLGSVSDIDSAQSGLCVTRSCCTSRDEGEDMIGKI